MSGTNLASAENTAALGTMLKSTASWFWFPYGPFRAAVLPQPPLLTWTRGAALYPRSAGRMPRLECSKRRFGPKFARSSPPPLDVLALPFSRGRAVVNVMALDLASLLSIRNQQGREIRHRSCSWRACGSNNVWPAECRRPSANQTSAERVAE